VVRDLLDGSGISWIRPALMNRGVRELHMKLAIATFAKLINTEIKLLACRSEKNTQQCS